jgi:hypothetical protein
MHHLKHPYECTAVRIRHAAVSMSKCTPVYAVYKVYPYSDYTVSHPLVGQTVILPLTHILLLWRIGWAPNSIPIYIQQDAKLHSLLISGNCSTCFGWYFYPSSGAHTTASTASGICHTVTAICHYRGRVGTGLSVLWVAYATHSTFKPVPTLPR